MWASASVQRSVIRGEKCIGSCTAARLFEVYERKTVQVSRKGRISVWSEHSEALAALADGQLQQFVQLLIGVVGWEAQLVKAKNKKHKRCAK